MTNFMNIDNRKDILLLLLYSPGSGEQVNDPIIGRTRFTKQLFLFKNEVLAHFKKGTSIDEDNFYQFFPWNFGPFSRDVYDDLTFFKLRKFVTSEYSNEDVLPESAEEYGEWIRMTRATSSGDESDIISEFQEEKYSLTEKGVLYTENLYDLLSRDQKKLLKEFKARTQKVPLRALLKYVYSNYTEFTTKSVIRDNVLG